MVSVSLPPLPNKVNFPKCWTALLETVVGDAADCRGDTPELLPHRGFIYTAQALSLSVGVLHFGPVSVTVSWCCADKEIKGMVLTLSGQRAAGCVKYAHGLCDRNLFTQTHWLDGSHCLFSRLGRPSPLCLNSLLLHLASIRRPIHRGPFRRWRHFFVLAWDSGFCMWLHWTSAVASGSLNHCMFFLPLHAPFAVSSSVDPST